MLLEKGDFFDFVVFEESQEGLGGGGGLWAGWSVEGFGLDADEGDGGGEWGEVVDEEAEGEGVGADVEGLDFVFGDAAEGAGGLVHVCGVEEDEVGGVVAFDGGGGAFGVWSGVEEDGVWKRWGVGCGPGGDGVVAVVWGADAEDEGGGHGRCPGFLL